MSVSKTPEQAQGKQESERPWEFNEFVEFPSKYRK